MTDLRRRTLLRNVAPAVAVACLTPAAALIAKPPIPEPADDFQLRQGDEMTAASMNRHIDVRAARVVYAQLAVLRHQGII